MPAVVGYLRVSKNDDVMAAKNERFELERAGYKIDFWHEDVISASTAALQRPGFVAMVKRMRDGETLVVSKLDQLGRDAMDVMRTVRMLTARSIHVVVHALGGADLTSPTGKLLLVMLSAVAEMERDLLVERTQAGVVRARMRGKTIGRPPKTSESDRREILSMLDGGETVSAVARCYKISRATVISIRSAKEGVCKLKNN